MIYNLQALRAVAALLVVLHHTRTMLLDDFPVLGEWTLGAAGVDLFFVISGVVITLSAQTRSMTPAGFAWQRMLRVVPMWWLALALFLLLMALGLAPLGLNPVDATLGNVLRSFFFLPYETAHGAIMPLVGVGWTLGYEMLFYALFAAALLLPAGIRVAAVLGMLGGLVLWGQMAEPRSVLLRVYTHPLLLEFAAGMVLARLWLAIPCDLTDGARRLARKLGAGLLLLALIGFAAGARPAEYDALMEARVILWGLPAFAAVAGAMALERGGVRLASPGIMLLGAASYALYLFHPFVLQAVAKIGGAVATTPADMILVAAMAVLLSQILAVIVYKSVERPLLQALRRPAVPETGVTAPG